MKLWLSQHWQALSRALRQLANTPLSSLLSIIVIGIAFSLPLGIYTMLGNLQAISSDTASTPQLSIFLKLNASQAEIENVNSKLEEFPHIASFQFISREIALQQLQQESSLNEVVNNLPKNPLPDAFIINLQQILPDELENIRAVIKKWSEIEHVQVDTDWARRVDALLRLGQLAVVMLAVVLGFALIIVVFNTIRLQILTKRDEIEVIKLIGATDSFIRRPFLYFGAIQGMAGAAAGWLLIALCIQAINESLMELTQLYATDFHLNYLSLDDSLSLLIFSALLGWLGARLSVAQHLSQIEPE
ncbi:permease-like cell division protein FtsX [Nitrosomonas sp. Nm34]|uniref:permease-like cell division protein FtsX n=1 Tax=Nitrosomonas sp. Nm34 TaxID=1881055 RepID=UPI0008E9C077|nr:permease-like cell division protein FtsX [Nitrosomonas sp. Nm34]SFI82101.1 cell division transport system permease protein [Nitrosomonas sp. Nm34]